MPQEIYNEGRVVGLSAWEIFMRDALANGVPPEVVPNEEQWLTAMIGAGASMILKIPANTSAGIHDFDLPQNSSLAAAGVIHAAPFLGSCAWDTSNWATKVTSYSPLISNTSLSYPSSSDVPSGTYDETDYTNIVAEFSKITDGIVFLNNATWLDAATQPPEKDIAPNYNNSYATVRLFISQDITYDTYIIFTGFCNKRILQALSGFAVDDGGITTGGSADIYHNNWVNGGMLGPEITPWASKIVFSVPNSVLSTLNALTRTLPADASNLDGIYYGFTIKNTDATVKSAAYLDFNSIELADYYNNHPEHSRTCTSEAVTTAPLGTADVLNELVAWYPGMTQDKITGLEDNSQFFPPALYAAQVSQAGTYELVPIDVAAPGTFKYFQDATQAYNYKMLFSSGNTPGVTGAIYHNTTNNTFSFVVDGETNPDNWPGTATLKYLSNAPQAQIDVGTQSAKFIALTNSSGTSYGTSGSAGTLAVGPTNNVTWDTLFTALTENKTLDILGTKLHQVGQELTATNTLGVTNSITEVGAATVTLNPGTASATSISSAQGTESSPIKYATFGQGSTIKVGTDFIRLNNGLKLYISNTEPTDNIADIPVGSIGIGW